MKGYLILSLILPTLLTLVILKLGYVKYATIYATLLIAGGTTYACMIGLGIHDTAIVIYPILILFASLVLDPKNLFLAAIMVALALIWVTLGEAYGGYQPGLRKSGFTSDSFIVSVMCIMAMIISSLFAKKIIFSIEQTNEDLGKRRVLEKRLQEHSAERSELLREVHHRVKNNLAFTSSLVDIEMMEKHTGPDNLRNIQNKIISIARANDPLFQSEKYESVDLSRYLNDLKGISFFPKNIVIDIKAVTIDVSQAVPIGVIIHEMAMIIAESQSSEVLIGLTEKGKDTILEIKGSDKNMKQVYENRPLEKLLIEIMVEDLKGSYNVVNGVFQLAF